MQAEILQENSCLQCGCPVELHNAGCRVCESCQAALQLAGNSAQARKRPTAAHQLLALTTAAAAAQEE